MTSHNDELRQVGASVGKWLGEIDFWKDTCKDIGNE